GRLMAASFDPSRLQVTGQPVAIDDRVSDRFSGAASFDVSRNGTFVNVSGNAAGFVTRFIWRSRDGKSSVLVGGEPQSPRYPRISPEGRRVAATVGPGRNGQIWVFDLAGGAQPLKLTFEGHNVFPTWMPSGHLMFARAAALVRAASDLNLTLLEMPS